MCVGYDIIPYAQNDLETLALRRWQDLLCAVAVRRRVPADDGGASVALDRVEIRLVVARVLAASVGQLGPQSEAESAFASGQRWHCGEGDARESRNGSHDVSAVT